MTRRSLTAALTALFVAATPILADDTPHVREQRRHAVGGELLGRGIILTANYEHFVSPHIGLGAGIMAIGTDEGGVFVLPLYASFLSGNTHNLYLGVGTSLFGGGGTISDFETSSFLTLSAGYQYHSESGFYVRPFFSYLDLIEEGDDSGGLIWPGIAIGGSF